MPDIIFDERKNYQPVSDLTKFTTLPVQNGRSCESIGLQIVDIYLWITNKFIKGDTLSSELKSVASLFLPKSYTDGISIEGLMERFHKFEQKLPPESSLSPEQKKLNDELIDKHRKKVARLDM